MENFDTKNYMNKTVHVEKISSEKCWGKLYDFAKFSGGQICWHRIRVKPEPEWLVFIQTDVAASLFMEIEKFKKVIFICHVV